MTGFGAGQGIAHRDGLLYLYGDFRGDGWSLDTPEDDYGCVREYRLVGFPGSPGLEYTGREIRLTRDGVNVAPHPTGLTFHPKHGCFLGDTVNRRGLIFKIDFDRALADGNLDHAILNVAVDDVASNGARPEFVEYGGRVLVATSDYGDERNEVRLYDPKMLGVSTRVSRPGALVERFESPSFVQTLHWDGARGRLVLVQNREPGRFYRLTFTELDGVALTRFEPLDVDGLDDELEGLFIRRVDRETYLVMLSAHAENNVSFARLIER